MGAHLSQQGNVRQNKSGDALPAPAARDADPAAEGHVRSPVVPKDAERVGELGFEGKQRGEVGVVAWRCRGVDNHDYCCREQKGDRNYKKRTAGKKSHGDDGQVTMQALVFGCLAKSTQDGWMYAYLLEPAACETECAQLVVCLGQSVVCLSAPMAKWQDAKLDSVDFPFLID